MTKARGRCTVQLGPALGQFGPNWISQKNFFRAIYRVEASLDASPLRGTSSNSA